MILCDHIAFKFAAAPIVRNSYFQSLTAPVYFRTDFNQDFNILLH